MAEVDTGKSGNAVRAAGAQKVEWMLSGMIRWRMPVQVQLGRRGFKFRSRLGWNRRLVYEDAAEVAGGTESG